jgi:hypothetical protein
MKKSALILSIFAASIFIFSVQSCRKKKDTIAKITVRNAAKEAVAGATVILYGESTTNPPGNVVRYDTATTNSSGEAIINYNEVYQLGQAGVAVLNIKATKDGAIGTGIIKIEEEKTNEKTVFIY